jgi:hypothetical protein
MNNKNLLSAVRLFIVIAILITVGLKIKMLKMMGLWNSDILGFVLLLVFYLSSVGSVIGLLLQRSWGFMSVYALVIVSTLLGIAIIPLPRLFPVSSRTTLVIFFNIIVFISAVLLQVRQNKPKIKKPR